MTGFAAYALFNGKCHKDIFNQIKRWLSWKSEKQEKLISIKCEKSPLT